MSIKPTLTDILENARRVNPDKALDMSVKNAVKTASDSGCINEFTNAVCKIDTVLRKSYGFSCRVNNSKDKRDIHAETLRKLAELKNVIMHICVLTETLPTYTVENCQDYTSAEEHKKSLLDSVTCLGEAFKKLQADGNIPELIFALGIAGALSTFLINYAYYIEIC